jgi:glycosyltransferase involved in cell wall biosynthesis
MTKVSVIIPVYNEEATIITLLEKVNDQVVDTFEFEIIVIDDGSTDETVKLLKEKPNLFSKLIERQKNGGKGAAVLSGLREATGDYILFQDADLEYDPADYTKLLKPVKLFSADVVMGSRLIASPITRVSYFWHKVGNRVITLMFNIFNNTTFTDIYSCYLLYKRDLVEPTKLKSMGWEQQAEILSVVVKSAKSVFEVPINYYGRSYDEGKKIRSHHAIGVLWMIVKKRLFG